MDIYWTFVYMSCICLTGMDIYWTFYRQGGGAGHLLDIYWTFYRQGVNIHWTFHGHLLDICIYVLYMSYSYGHLLDIL